MLASLASLLLLPFPKRQTQNKGPDPFGPEPLTSDPAGSRCEGTRLGMHSQYFAPRHLKPGCILYAIPGTMHTRKCPSGCKRHVMKKRIFANSQGPGVMPLVNQGYVGQGRSQWDFLVHLGTGWTEFFLQQVETGNDTQALLLGQRISVNQSGDVFRGPY